MSDRSAKSERSSEDTWVRAGAIAKKSAKTDPVTTGELVAMEFTHPAVEGRTIVRLVEASLDGATEAEMNVLGFAPAGEKTTVGRTRKRALGFPAWALVHHPSKARFALEVMRDFRKGATRAKTKPGHAKDAFTEIAKKLERSVPAFMPSYWEEVGRTFLAEDAANLASQAFEKARTAERAYKLAVDEDLRAAAYLEFSAAGAVPAKSLAGYADDLTKAFGPKEAERRFFELNVQRIKGGAAPWTGMAKELSKLAKAAGRNDADLELLGAVLASPSLKKAPPDFWATYRDALIALAKSSREAKARIVWLFPEPRSFQKFLPTWLDLLDEIGAVDLAVETNEAARFASALTRFVTFSDDWGDREEPITPRYFTMLEALAKTLVKTGEPLALDSYRRWGDDGEYSPDILEAALALGLTLEKPKGEDPSVSLGDAFVKDPQLLEAHPEYGKLLEAAVARKFGEAEFEARAKGKKGLVAARRKHLLGVIEKLAKGALPAVNEHLETLTESTSAATFTEFPEAVTALEAVSVGSAFARTLRGGLVDELTWPAFEEALAAFAGPKAEIELHGTRQHPVVRSGRKIVVFDGRVRLEERDLPPIAKEPKDILYVDGDLLITFDDPKTDKNSAIWASHAKDAFPLDMWRSRIPEIAELAGGGATTGEGVALHRGDKPEKIRFHAFATDGTTVWQGRETYEERLKLLELDPKTGKTGRASWPAFVREASEVSDRFALREVQLMPLRNAEGALTGYAGGLTGRYVRRDDATRDVQITRIDGKSWSGIFTPDALLDFPGTNELRPVSVSGAWSEDTSDELTIYGGVGADVEPTGEFGDDKWKSAAFPLLPREAWLDYLTVRDEAASRVLRAVTDEVASAILAEAAEDDAEDDDALTHSLAAVEKHLPQLKNAVLKRAVAIVAKVATGHQTSLGRLRESGGGEGASDDAFEQALPQVPTEGYEDGFCTTDMKAVGAAFRDKKRSKLSGSRISWELFVEHLAKVACFIATRASTGDEARATLREIAKGVAESGLLGLTVTRAELQVKTGSTFFSGKAKHVDTFFADLGGQLVFARVVDEDEDEPQQKVSVLAAGEDFVPPADATLTSKTTLSIPDDRAFVDEVLRDLEAKGPVPHATHAAAKVAAAVPLTPAEAVLLLAGLPSFNEYKNDFLGKELRATLDLKQGDASKAKDKLRELPNGQLFALLAGAANVPSAASLWALPEEPGSSAEALITTAKALLGKTVVVREELVSVVDRELQIDLPSRKALAMVLTASSPENTWLTARKPAPRWFQVGHSGDFFSAEVVATIGKLVPFLATSLPVGDEYRAAIPALYDRAKANLEAPDFLLPLGERYEEDAKKAAAILDRVGGKKVSFDTSVDQSREGRDNGTVIAVLAGEDNVELGLRTSSLRANRAAVLPYLGVGGSGSDDDDELYGLDAARAAYYLLSKECEELVESVRTSKAPEGSYELDPSVSAKKVVKEMAAAAGIDEDAAALYLQMLAVPNPSKKNVMLWNGWKPARYDAAVSTLTKKKLVIEGKRERAGRDVFLPGAWEKKSRGLSLEAYKVPIYDRVSFDEPCVTVAPKTLFSRAFARWSSGEKPGFVDVTKKAPKKK